MSDQIWQVDISTAQDQERPETLSHRTRIGLRHAVYSRLLTTHPLSIRSGTHLVQKQGERWTFSGGEDDEQAYRWFCDNGLDMCLTPRGQAKHREGDALRGRLERAYHVRALALSLFTVGWVGMIFSSILSFLLSLVPENPLLRFAEYTTLAFGAVAMIGLLLSLGLKARKVNVLFGPEFHHWFNLYGMQATATVVGRKTVRDEDADQWYWLEFVWHHPETQQHCTSKVHTEKEHYEACFTGSRHPVLFDPDAPTVCQFYLSEVRVSDIIAGTLS